MSHIIIFLSTNRIAWATSKQASISHSNTEAKYRALTNTQSKVSSIKALLVELHVSIASIPILWCANQGVINLVINLVLDSKMKHVELDVHFIREHVFAKPL